MGGGVGGGVAASAGEGASGVAAGGAHLGLQDAIRLLLLRHDLRGHTRLLRLLIAKESVAGAPRLRVFPS